MLTQIYRPGRFAEVFGAEAPKFMLRKIVKNPETAPRVLVLAGERGCGKTTSVRIFVKALNCENKRDGDCCNECPTCKSINDASPFYAEFDSSVVGNVDEMKNIRALFSYSVLKGNRVIAFDECHLVSKAAQSSLLKVLEEAPKGLFFVFLTTDPDRIIPTIHSRSIQINFDNLTEVETSQLLKMIADKEGMQVASETLRHIFRRVKGHARDAVQQLEMVRLLGDEGYQFFYLRELVDQELYSF